MFDHYVSSCCYDILLHGEISVVLITDEGLSPLFCGICDNSHDLLLSKKSVVLSVENSGNRYHLLHYRMRLATTGRIFRPVA